MGEPRVYVAQVLCPSRHAIMAGAAVATSHEEAVQKAGRPVLDKVREFIRTGAVNPWCGICGAKEETWKLDVDRTRYSTMEEALPALSEVQEKNLLAKLLLGGHPGPGKTD